MNLPGIAEWFQFEKRERVRQTARVLQDLNIREFRILFSWADWERPGGPEWFDFFIGEIGGTETRLIPDLFYTPINLARPNEKGERKTSHAPVKSEFFAQFVRTMIEKYGHYFDWIQIWNEPNWKPYWEWDIDPDASLFCEMAGQAAEVIHEHGKKAALGGCSPYEPEYITQVAHHGLLKKIDAVGIHFSPSWENQRQKWYGWDTQIKTARAHLKGLGYDELELWVPETGFATTGKTKKELDESYRAQIEFFDSARKAKADKVLWYSVFDQSPDHPTDDSINIGEDYQSAAFHFGLIDTEGVKKPLYDHWKKLAKN